MSRSDSTSGWVQIGQTTTASDGSYQFGWSIDNSVAVGHYQIQASFTGDSSNSYAASTAQTTASPGLSVAAALAPPSLINSVATVDQGQNSYLTSSALTTGTSPYTYQWFEKAPGGSYATAGSNSPSFNFVTTSTTATGSWSFILQVTDSAGEAANSTASTVTVNAAVSVSVAPSSWTMDVSQSKAFTATASGGSGALSYQWYLAGSAVSSQTGATYLFTAASSGSPTIYCTVTEPSLCP